jgi:hypothetical protein
MAKSHPSADVTLGICPKVSHRALSITILVPVTKEGTKNYDVFVHFSSLL